KRTSHWLNAGRALAILSVLANPVGYRSNAAVDSGRRSAPPARSSPFRAESMKAQHGGFEANLGQFGQPAKFLYRGSAYSLFLNEREAAFTLGQPAPGSGKLKKKPSDKAGVVRIGFAGANSGVTVEGLDRLPGKTNYLIGSDPRNWRD